MALQSEKLKGVKAQGYDDDDVFINKLSGLPTGHVIYIIGGSSNLKCRGK